MVNIKTVLYLTISWLLLILGPQANMAQANDEAYVGQMIWVPFNFAPRGWASCNGQLLPISQNTALFSLLGTQYGGDGKSTFALPDMQGRLLVHSGQGAGLSLYDQGETGGEETHTLTVAELPQHSHTLQVSAAPGDSISPIDKYFAASNSGLQYSDSQPTTMEAQVVGTTGNAQPHNNMMPYTTLHCIIALEGRFPPR